MNNALSSLHKLLRNRLVGGRQGGVVAPPPSLQPLQRHKHTHSLARSVTINAKTTVHCSLGSSMPQRHLTLDNRIGTVYKVFSKVERFQ
jgi:hypothetical protein